MQFEKCALYPRNVCIMLSFVNIVIIDRVSRREYFRILL